MSRIRPIAIAIIRRGDAILVGESTDSVRNLTFHRPLGGGIHFGEQAEAAVRREILEEIGAELDQVRLLGTLENIFVNGGQPGHEVVFAFEAIFADPVLYERDEFEVVEGEFRERAIWRPLHQPHDSVPLFPESLRELLTPSVGTRDPGLGTGDGAGR